MIRPFSVLASALCLCTTTICTLTNCSTAKQSSSAPHVAASNPVAATSEAPPTSGVPAGPDTIARAAQDFWDFWLKDQEPAFGGRRFATQFGDHRFDRDLEDISPEADAARDHYRHAMLARLESLDPNGLDDEGRLNRELIAHEMKAELGREVCHFEEWQIDHLEGYPASFGEISQYQTTETREHAEALLARYRKIPAFLLQHQANLRRGLGKGWVAAKINVTRQEQQLEQMLKTPIESSPFLPKREGFAVGISAAEQDALYDQLKTSITGDVLPALAGYLTFIRSEIEPKARTQPGLLALPFGAECYAAMIYLHTGLKKTPQEIHDLGLSEVKRITGDMEALAKKKTKKPDIRAYIEKLKKDPHQHVNTREELIAYYTNIVTKATTALPGAFGRLPESGVQVKAIESFREKEAPGAYYNEAPIDRSRPAYFYLNTYEPEQRYLFDAEELTYHESVPGHHLQIALAQEIPGLATFRRELAQTAFTEGWALYAEYLASELGLYSSDESQLGRMNGELWRAKRLVVDTGLHALGWSREQALQFMLENSSTGVTDVTNETDRYISWPGQALAYKIGELEIRRLRHHAEQVLGKRFDLKAFHDEVLRRGAIPIDILAECVERWINAQAAGN